jgi:hypothetical protein
MWPRQNPEFAILNRDGLRLLFGEAEASGSGSSATLWLDVEELAALHSTVQTRTTIEWGPEVYSYGRREFGFPDPDRNSVILSEVTSDPPTSEDTDLRHRAEQRVAADRGRKRGAFGIRDWVHTPFGGHESAYRRARKMVGWAGIEPPTPGFSDPPASPGSDE